MTPENTFTRRSLIRILWLHACFCLLITSCLSAGTYPVVDTAQVLCFNTSSTISCPQQGERFYGQDSQYAGNPPSYTDNGDGTISDNVTGLMWQKSPDLNGDGSINYDDKLTWDEAIAAAEAFDLAGYDDWRIPTIKELYSPILFSGLDPSGEEVSRELVPFIDTDYFDFAYGDTGEGERIIDAQFVTSTLYMGTVMMGSRGMFGVNFADGRIKGYGIDPPPGQSEGKRFYVLHVRGRTDYGANDYFDNGDGTVSDRSSGLMWSREDSGVGMNWEEALAWVDQKNQEAYLGYTDWRLPNAKELQSIVDYTRAPSVTDSAALDPIFSITSITNEIGEKDYPYFWSSTTHANGSIMPGMYGAYVAFGRASGWMEVPPGSGIYTYMDVHGAGAQRSDPKVGDPGDYPFGHGPQGDVIRIYNYVRLVRDYRDRSHSRPFSFR